VVVDAPASDQHSGCDAAIAVAAILDRHRDGCLGQRIFVFALCRFVALRAGG